MGASLGLLRIGAGGSYSWTKGKAVRSRGQLEEVRPHNYSEQGVRYWRLRSERDEYYLSLTPDGLTLYSPGTNLYAASARRKK